MVGQHHAARAHADGLRATGDVAHQHGRGRAGNAGHVVVLGQPVAGKAQFSACWAVRRAICSASATVPPSRTATRSSMDRACHPGRRRAPAHEGSDHRLARQRRRCQKSADRSGRCPLWRGCHIPPVAREPEPACAAPDRSPGRSPRRPAPGPAPSARTRPARAPWTPRTAPPGASGQWRRASLRWQVGPPKRHAGSARPPAWRTAGRAPASRPRPAPRGHGRSGPGAPPAPPARNGPWRSSGAAPAPAGSWSAPAPGGQPAPRHRSASGWVRPAPSRPSRRPGPHPAAPPRPATGPNAASGIDSSWVVPSSRVSLPAGDGAARPEDKRAARSTCKTWRK
jgi:hypothetical protein